MKTSFYAEKELTKIGFLKFGKNTLISKKASIYSPEKISLGKNVRIDDFCILSGNIHIGDYIHIAPYSGLFAGDYGIVLEDFVNISSRVSIYAISDDFSGESLTNPMICNKYKEMIEGRVILKRHVIIGSGAVILPNLEIGTGSAVGALSLVNTSLPDWGIYAGIPVKKIRTRSKRLKKLEKEFLKEEKDVT